MQLTERLISQILEREDSLITAEIIKINLSYVDPVSILHRYDYSSSTFPTNFNFKLY